MKRTKLRDRVLPTYSKGEERFHMISHIVGGGLGGLVLVAGILLSAIRGDAWAVVSSAIYGTSLILVYVMSSLYHGLRPGAAKKVLQVLDHCTIYLLIAGTYTPITLCAVRRVSPAWAWSLFGLVWGLAVIGILFTAIDLKKYARFSMLCYLGMGWCVVIAVRPMLRAVAPGGLVLLLAGGIAYSVGAVLYGIGKRKKWMHATFHLFVVLGSVLHAACVLLYVL